MGSINWFRPAETPRSPCRQLAGHNVELALGWLVSEGVVRHADDVVQAKECYEKAPEEVVDEIGVRRLVEVTTRVPGVLRPRLHPTSSACGVCGGDVIAMTLSNRAKAPGTPDSSAGSPLINSDFLLALPHLMRDAQRHLDASGECTQQRYSLAPATSSACARMSGVTMPSTRSSDGRSHSIFFPCTITFCR